jgi:hypothetical protein
MSTLLAIEYKNKEKCLYYQALLFRQIVENI